MGVTEEFVGTLAARPDTPTSDSNLNEKHSQRVQGNADVLHEAHDETITRYESHTDTVSYQYLTFTTEIATEPIWPNGITPTNTPQIPNYQQYDDPYGWSRNRKNLMTYLACSVNGMAGYTSGAYASPADILMAKWQVSHLAYNVGITIFTIGFGVAPMILAPFSEINGRRPVFIASGVLFVLSQLGCAVTESYGGMLTARLFVGIGGSTFSTMVGGILADIWITKDRNTAMVLFAGTTLAGTGCGPLVSGYVTERLGWRWVFYVQLIISGVLVGLVTIFFRETRGSVLLSRKAKMLNRYYEDLEAAGAIGVLVPRSETGLVAIGAATPPAPVSDHARPPTSGPLDTAPAKVVHLRYRVKSDEERASLLKMISISLYRPIHMLFTEPVVFWFSCWVSFAWALLYLQFGSVPLVFRTNYGFTLEQTGLVFISQCVCAILFTIFCIYQEKWGMKYFPNRIGGSPEGRMYFVCVEAALLPVGIFMFGWTCDPSMHWIAPTIAVGIMTMGIFSIYLGVFNYSADVYRTYASSALAASGVCRNLVSGAISLLTRPMFEKLGYQVASSVLGAIATVLTFVPIVLVLFGPTIRRRSKIARQFEEEDKLKDEKVDGRDEEERTGSTSETRSVRSKTDAP